MRDLLDRFREWFVWYWPGIILVIVFVLIIGAAVIAAYHSLIVNPPIACAERWPNMSTYYTDNTGCMVEVDGQYWPEKSVVITP